MLKAEQTLDEGLLERQSFVSWTLYRKFLLQQQPLTFLKGAAPVARYNRLQTTIALNPLSFHPPSRAAWLTLSMVRSFCTLYFFFLSGPNNGDCLNRMAMEQASITSQYYRELSCVLGQDLASERTTLTWVILDGQKHPHKHFSSSSIPPYLEPLPGRKKRLNYANHEWQGWCNI